jgi:hypothetical protein
VGADAFDQLCARARVFATQRARSFELLFAVLDAPGVPPPEQWAAWQATRRVADTLWTDWRVK